MKGLTEMAKITKEALHLRYGRITGKFWQSARKHGWDDATTCLAAYLLTCEHHSIEGFFRLPVHYIMADLGWPSEKVLSGLKRLWAARFCFYHAESEVIFIPKALKYQTPKGDKQIHGCLRRLAVFEEHPLFPTFLRAAHLYTAQQDESFYEELTSWFRPDFFASYDTNESLDQYLIDQPPPTAKFQLNGHLNEHPDERSTSDERSTNNRRSLKHNPNPKLKPNKEAGALQQAEAPPPLSVSGEDETW